MARAARPPLVPAAPPPGLSPQQLEVHSLACKGLRVAEIATALKTSQRCVRKQLHEIRTKAKLAVEVSCAYDYYTASAAGYTYPLDRYGQQVAPVAAVGEGVHTVSVRRRDRQRSGVRSGRPRRYYMSEEERAEHARRKAEEEGQRRQELELKAPLERQTLEVLQGARVQSVCGCSMSKREFLIGAALAGVAAARPVLRRARRDAMREIAAASRGVILSASPRAAALVMRYAPASVAAGLKMVKKGCFRADARVAGEAQEALVCAELAVDRRFEAYPIDRPRIVAGQATPAVRLDRCAQVCDVREIDLPEEELAQLLQRALRAREISLRWPDGSTTTVVARRVLFVGRRPGRDAKYRCLCGADILMPGDRVVVKSGILRVVAWGACGPPVVVARTPGLPRDGPLGREPVRENLMAVRRKAAKLVRGR